MNIRDFKEVRVGSGFPAIFDIRPIEGHECYGIYAEIPVAREGQRIELRRSKDGEIALFNFKYDDISFPSKRWEDSEILWQNTNK